MKTEERTRFSKSQLSCLATSSMANPRKFDPPKVGAFARLRDVYKANMRADEGGVDVFGVFTWKKHICLMFVFLMFLLQKRPIYVFFCTK